MARIQEWAAYSFSRGSSWPRNWTKVSCISGRFFTTWAIREAHSLPCLLRFISFELVLLSYCLILCRPLLLLPSTFPSIKIFFNKSALTIRCPKCWSFSFSINPPNEYPVLIPLGLIDLISLQSKGLSRVFSSSTIQKHQFFGPQSSLWSNSHMYTWLLEKP